MRTLIVGAGIAGLSLAVALHRKGIGSDIVERSAGDPPVGAGVYLPGNATRALDRLGLGAALAAHAVTVPRQRFLDHRGRLLRDIDLAGFWGDCGPCLAVTHHDLREVLRQAVAGLPLRLGTTVTALDDDGEQVSVALSDGTERDYDLVVGADGVHSTTRGLLGGGSAEPVGQLSWRFIVEGGDVSDWTVLLGKGRAFLAVPLPERRLYCYADVDSRGGDPPGDDVTAVRRLFGEFGGPVPDILARLPEQLYRSRIEEVPVDTWGRGRVLLLGDAAHAASPNMAQGVAMAVEDALVLADLLAEPTNAAPATLRSALSARRSPRTSWIRTQTHRRDRTRGLPSIVRNTVLRAAGERIYHSNYRPLLAPP